MLGALLLGMTVGCGDSTRQALGIDRASPDEFAVVSRAPLTLPPEYSLRPPAPGAPRPQERDPRRRAETVVFDQGGAGGGETLLARQDGRVVQISPGEGALLARAGADSIEPDIRQVVDRETRDIVLADRGFVNRLLFWQEPPPPGEIVEPEEEARRLASNQALGAPITEGETPTVERRERAPLEGLFDF